MKTQMTKTTKMTALSLLAVSAVASHSLAQNFSSGSDGSYGPINITSNTTLDLPTNGIFNCTTISVAANATLSFNRNPLNTSVYLLATGDVAINGTIDVSGKPGSTSPPIGGAGGPGGFDGGVPGDNAGPIPPGAGYGPGGGKGGVYADAVSGAGSGSYGSIASSGNSTNKGAIYGSPLLVPLVGGSGGGGSSGAPGRGGDGGGGAILVASNTRIEITNAGKIYASGGGCNSVQNGSGGAIRLIAPLVAGNGILRARGVSEMGCSVYGGDGRIRIDCTDRRALQLGALPSARVGAFMTVFPNPIPRLDIVEAAGTLVPEGTGGPVLVTLPFGSPTNQTIKVQARNFNGVVPINVVLTPESGDPVTFPATIDNQAANPAMATVNVVVPVNVVVTVNAWTR